MKMIVIALLFQMLTASDATQMEKAPDLGYVQVQHSFALPDGLGWGAASSVAMNSEGHILVFNRGPYPLLEFDRDGKFVRTLGEGRYFRPHGMRIDAEDNIWTTDVRLHTVTKMNPRGDVQLVLGVTGQAGDWNEAGNSRLFNEPTDLAFSPTGDIFVTQGHGRGDPRVLKFDKSGKFIKSWGGKGTGPGQFDLAHSIVIDSKGLVYVADRENRRIQIFDLEGKFIREWKYAGLPCGLYISPDQQMYMVTGTSGQILKLDTNGKAVAATGQPGKGLGQFGEAHYLTLGPKGEIYVADPTNQILRKFVKR